MNIRRIEQEAATWFACYAADGDPLFRFYQHEDFAGWRDGFDHPELPMPKRPTRHHAAVGWLCRWIARTPW